MLHAYPGHYSYRPFLKSRTASCLKFVFYRCFTLYTAMQSPHVAKTLPCRGMSSDTHGGRNYNSRSISFSLHAPTLVYNPQDPVKATACIMNPKSPKNESDMMLKSLFDEAGMANNVSSNSNGQVASALNSQNYSASKASQSSSMDVDEIINTRKRPSPDRDAENASPPVAPPKEIFRGFHSLYYIFE